MQNLCAWEAWKAAESAARNAECEVLAALRFEHIGPCAVNFWIAELTARRVAASVLFHPAMQELRQNAALCSSRTQELTRYVAAHIDEMVSHG